MSKIKAVVFDVDGTLYNQTILRILISVKMTFAFVTSPKKFIYEFRIIREFRKFQEKLRDSDSYAVDELTQVRLTSDKLKIDYDKVSKVVDKWFNQIPLPLISICKRRGLKKTFRELSEEGYKFGIFSDYPAENKIEALGIKNFFDVIVCSSDSDVGKFKPASDGFIMIAGKLNLKTNEIVYVGDRLNVDVTGAENAGMIPLLIGKFSLKKKSYLSCYRFKTITKLIKRVNE